jgi:hypothetical protein
MDKLKKPDLSRVSGVIKKASIKNAKEELVKVAHAVDHMGEKIPSRPNSVELMGMVQGGIDTVGADLKKVGNIVEHFPANFAEQVAEIDLVPGELAGQLKGLKKGERCRWRGCGRGMCEALPPCHQLIPACDPYPDYMPQIKMDGDFNIELYSNEAAKKAAKKEARKKKREKRDAKLRAKEEKRLAKIQEMNELAEQKRQQEEEEFEEVRIDEI